MAVTNMRSSVAGLWLAAAFYRFRESLFLLPALLVLAGVALAELTAAVDRVLRSSAPWTLQMSSNAATWLLATVAGATITTAGGGVVVDGDQPATGQQPVLATGDALHR